MAQNVVRIMLDIWAGPIWGCIYDEDNKEYDYYIHEIAQDKELMMLHQQIQDLYSSYYRIDYKDQPVYFDSEQEKADKEKMLGLLNKLIEKLSEINDGSFIIDDRETERVKNL